MNTVIIGECGINHNSDINIAKQLIDVCSELNLPYVKFQKRDIESTYTKEFLDSPRESPWGNTQRAQKEALELSLEQYKEIDEYCNKKGNIGWFASPWDLKSITFLKENFPNMPYLKIPSAKVTDEEYLKKCVESGFDLIMSTGMSDLSMVQKAVLIVKDKLKYLLHCCSTYPNKTEELNLSQIRLLSYYFKNLNCKIGFSNHHQSVLFMAEAVIFGAEMIETHITLGRHLYGSDQSVSIEPQGLRKLIKYIKETEKAIGTLDKKILDSEIPIMNKLRNL